MWMLEPFTYFFTHFVMRPFVGYAIELPEFGKTSAYGALGEIGMARTNSKCVSNVYEDLAETMKPDYKFASDMDFYLNAMEAS